MKKIYICSPVRGDENNPAHLKQNLARAAVYAQFVFHKGYFPICSQVYLDRVTGWSEVDHPEKRDKLLELGIEMLLMSDELWVFGREPGRESSGMKAEIKKANELRMPVVYRAEYLPDRVKEEKERLWFFERNKKV